MDETAHSISWEAPEHRHVEKTPDWYWILGIISIAGAVLSIIFDNALFGIVIILGAFTMMLVSHRKPRIIQFEVGERGVRIDDALYPYATLESYFLDENNIVNPQLILKSKKLFMMLLIIPIPIEHISHIESVVNARLPEEHLEEPFAHHILEYFGF